MSQTYLWYVKLRHVNPLPIDLITGWAGPVEPLGAAGVSIAADLPIPTPGGCPRPV